MATYIIKKKIQAQDMAEAVRKDKKTEVQEIWLDERQEDQPKADAIGFRYDSE